MNCMECSDNETCDVCKPGVIPEYDGKSCIPIFEGCKIPIKAQHKSGMLDVLFDKYMCQECAPGYVHDKSNFRRCIKCSTVIEGCTNCGQNDDLGIYECYSCVENHIPVFDRCDAAAIENCKIADIHHPGQCMTCQPGSSLNQNKTACVSCSGFGDACASCALDGNGWPT